MNENNKVEVEVFQQTKKNETECGDSYFYFETDKTFICVLVDGLGSGKYAKESSQVVIDVIKRNVELTEEQLIRKCITKLNGKRGVVLGLLKINFNTETFTYTSIGNIGFVTKRKNKKRKLYIPKRGFLSNYERPLKKVIEKLKPGTSFLLFSDGVSHSEVFQSFIPNVYRNNWLAAFPIDYDEESNDDITIIAMHYN